MGEYIEREAAQKIICGWCGVCSNPTLKDLVNCDDICPQFAKIPAADVRPVGLLEQVEWERDIALAQLAEIGKSFGEKMDDVRPVVLCRDCKHSDTFAPDCTEATFPLKCLSIRYGGVYPNWFCEHGEKREES